MSYILEPLTDEHLYKLLADYGTMATSMHQSYMSTGSVGYCVVDDGEPVFAAGIVNMQWNRGEAWILPTEFFRSHIRLCYRYVRDMISVCAYEGGFKRVQAYCSKLTSNILFIHLGFKYEGTLEHFGPNGETWDMYSRLF